MSELDDIQACAANAHKVAMAWDTRSIGPKVDMTDNNYKFQKGERENMEKACEIDKDTSFECHRCGRCCMHMHSDDTGMPCESLLVEDGIATCLIHEYKPEVCQNYPTHPDFGGEPCLFAREYPT